tara:strand:- start:1339 stop:2145 length:807 start_codon:yes stop_codon:yes gene_type:complete
MIVPFPIRRLDDGSYWLARHDIAKEKWLDENMIRFNNELRWASPLVTDRQLSDLSALITGKTVAIVGKGPSLDYLAALDADVVIAINQSIKKVDAIDHGLPVIMMQQDTGPKDTCYPKDGIVLVREEVGQWYSEAENLVLYGPHDFGCTDASLTAIVAVQICKRLCAEAIVMYCFDSIAGILGYAECCEVKPEDGGDPKRFNLHSHKIKDSLEGIDHTFVFPSAETPDIDPQPAVQDDPDQFQLPLETIELTDTLEPQDDLELPLASD